MGKHIQDVEPLRTTQDIAAVQYFLKQGKYGARNSLVFLIGINTGLRCSDIVQLKVGTVRNDKMPLISEKKTSKKRQINLKGIAKEIDDYISEQDFKSDDDYLFPSQKMKKDKRTSSNDNSHNEHLSVNGFYKVMRHVGFKLGRKDLGTHTMRKTFGYHFYRKTGDIMLVSHTLNHSSPSITARYIGITEDEINKNLTDFRLG
ncbi:hypothetical protein DY052_06105 [Apilactobacillus timberlakei]|uniref:tyrosine-type recombinase/integrase n=1 Tax=Apilactobacillus timberlakei TaxID=2008380 RepID=UPI001126BDC3|nr:tyrosine-type recombinase/integrase [Apilactobacillus timberlakei]TPR14997.1 hypothetical protein DY052_06105 [Apilactobacillus timberlakei]